MSQIIFTPKSDDWTKRTNCILMDLETLKFKIHERTRGNLRLYLGKLIDDDFIATIESINEVPHQLQEKIRKELRFLVTEVINPKEDERERLNIKKYLQELREFQAGYDRDRQKFLGFSPFEN